MTLELPQQDSPSQTPFDPSDIQWISPPKDQALFARIAIKSGLVVRLPDNDPHVAVFRRTSEELGVPFSNLYRINTESLPPTLAIAEYAVGTIPGSQSFIVGDGALRNLTDREMRAVVQHEAGHQKHYGNRSPAIHIAQQLGYKVAPKAATGVALYEAGATGNPLLLLLAFVCLMSVRAAGKAQKRASYDREFAADSYVDDVEAFTSALMKISQGMLLVRQGPQHPSTAERIRRLVEKSDHCLGENGPDDICRDPGILVADALRQVTVEFPQKRPAKTSFQQRRLDELKEERQKSSENQRSG